MDDQVGRSVGVPGGRQKLARHKTFMMPDALAQDDRTSDSGADDLPALCEKCVADPAAQEAAATGDKDGLVCPSTVLAHVPSQAEATLRSVALPPDQRSAVVGARQRQCGSGRDGYLPAICLLPPKCQRAVLQRAQFHAIGVQKAQFTRHLRKNDVYFAGSLLLTNSLARVKARATACRPWVEGCFMARLAIASAAHMPWLDSLWGW